MPRNRQPSEFESLAGFILAGGGSSYTGLDQGLALFGGISLIQIAFAAFAEVQIPAEIAGSRNHLTEYGRESRDAFRKSGPLASVHTALSKSNAAWNVFLPVDLPLMPASLLASLLRRAQWAGSPITATTLNGRLEPFPVVLHRSTSEPIARQLASGVTDCDRAWESICAEMGEKLNAVSVETLLQCGQCSPGRRRNGLPPAVWFQSADTPEDLARLNRMGSELRPARRFLGEAPISAESASASQVI